MMITRGSRRTFPALLAVSLLAGTALGQSSFRGFWADAFSVGFKSQSEINNMVSRAVSGRYNALVVEVLAFHDNVGSGHGAYWNSAIVPKAADINPPSLDPLAATITAAHAAGLQVHAWIVPYRVCSVWPPANNPYLAAHPEFLMVPRAAIDTGPATVGGYYTLDPGSPHAQEYLTSIVRELVTNYAIDGVNLDYIRYVTTDAGYPAVASYDASGLARFQQITGFVGVPNATGVTAWNDFRRRTIDEYVRRLRAEIPAIANPRQPLRLSGDLICFGNAPANFTSSDAYNLHQNWRMWMEKGWLDTGMPMNYKREHVSNEATWYRNWVNAAIGWRYNRHMVTGQAPYLNTKANSVTQLAYGLNAGSNGVITFSYDATADENTNGTPETDWTWYTYVSANLFTTSATIPAMPWRNPATAIEGTLWGRVTDGDTGEPIDDATVQVGALAPVQTDGNGYWVVTLIPATAGGTHYNVTASYAGCSPVTANSVPVFAGGIARRDLAVCRTTPLFGDFDLDGDVDFLDLDTFAFCWGGPSALYPLGNLCLRGDADGDRDVDLLDFSMFQITFGQ